MKSKAMKRIGNLYDKIIAVENLQLADQKARRGKLRSYGVRRHDKNREANILALHEALKNKTFKTSQYETFIIKDPKEREIYRLPYFPDRIVHHAIMNILEPIWVSVFTTDTFSCIKNRGINGCMQKVDKALKDVENTRYCLKIDVKKFYPSIDHDVLKQIVRRKIKCTDTLALLDQIIDSAAGVTIGNYLSQYFANLRRRVRRCPSLSKSTTTLWSELSVSTLTTVPVEKRGCCMRIPSLRSSAMWSPNSSDALVRGCDGGGVAGAA